MTIDRKLPAIFTKAIGFALKQKGLSCAGTFPSPIKFRRVISDFKKMSLALPFDLLIRSLKIGEQSCPNRLPNQLGKHNCFVHLKLSYENKTLDVFRIWGT